MSRSVSFIWKDSAKIHVCLFLLDYCVPEAAAAITPVRFKPSVSLEHEQHAGETVVVVVVVMIGLRFNAASGWSISYRNAGMMGTEKNVSS